MAHSQTPRRRLAALWPPLAYAALAVALTWPLAAHVGEALGGGLDPLLQAWVLAWGAHALTTDPSAVWQAPIFFPYPDTLAYSDHHLLLAALTAPLAMLGESPLPAYNLLVLLSYALSGWAVYLLARDTLRDTDLPLQAAAAFFAGALFAFGTFRMTHFVHLQLLQTAWLPLALLFLRRLLHPQGGRLRNGLLFGLFAGLQGATALYYAYFAALAIGLYVLLWLLGRIWRRLRAGERLPWRRLAGLLLGAATAALIVVPLTLPYLEVYRSLGIVRSVAELENWSAPLQAYLAVDPASALYGSAGGVFAPSGGEFALFPGFVVLLLAGLWAAHALWWSARAGPALWRPPAQVYHDSAFWMLLAAAAFVLSLGTAVRLVRGGEPLLSIPLPYPRLYELVPGFGALRVPARWAMLVTLSLALLAGCGLAWALRPGAWVWLRAAAGRGAGVQRWWRRMAAGQPERTIRGKRAVARTSADTPGWVQGQVARTSADTPGWVQRMLAPTTTRWDVARATWRLPALVAVLALGLAEHAGRPLALATPPPPPPVYAWLGQPAQRDLRVVLELPVGRTPRGAELERTTLRQYYQTLHWKTLPVGYSGLIPFGTTDLLGIVQRLPDEATLRYLQLVGVDTIVVHQSQVEPARLPELLAFFDASPLLTRRGEVGDALVYQLAAPELPPLARGAPVFVSDDERVPGVLALALLRQWQAVGRPVYGAGRTRYYPPLTAPRLGEVARYGLLAAEEDPLPHGYEPAGLRWSDAGLALYEADPRLRASLELGVVPAGAFHPVRPATLDLRAGRYFLFADRVEVGWANEATVRAAELDVASVVSQTLTVGRLSFDVGPGVTTLRVPLPNELPVPVAGLPDQTALLRVRVLELLAEPATLPRPEALAVAAESRFEGSRLLVEARAGGTGTLLVEARGAAARDDRPILLFAGRQPLAPGGGPLAFDVDLLRPAGAWLSEAGAPADGRYQVYLKDAARPAAPGLPIATFTVRDGALADPRPVPLPLTALP